MVPTTSPLPGSFAGSKVELFAAFKAAARRRESPDEVRQEMTFPLRLTRTVTVMLPEIPSLRARAGYSAGVNLRSVPASNSPVTGEFPFGSATVGLRGAKGEAAGDEVAT